MSAAKTLLPLQAGSVPSAVVLPDAVAVAIAVGGCRRQLPFLVVFTALVSEARMVLAVLAAAFAFLLAVGRAVLAPLREAGLGAAIGR